MAKVGQLVKESSASEISTRLGERPNFFIASVNRLSSPDTDLLRRQLFGLQARLLMVKRRMGRRTLATLKVAGLPDLLEGTVGIVLVADDVAGTAKLLIEFRKGHEEQLFVRGALIDGQLLDKARVEELAKLPPKPVLLAQVLGMIEAPISDVIFTIERLIGDVAWLAEQIAAQKPAPAPAAASEPAATPAPEAAQPQPPQSEPESPKPQEGTS